MISTGFWMILISLFIYGVLHSIVASLTFKRWARGLFGPAVDHAYRLGFSLFAVISFLPVMVLYFLMSDRVLYQVPMPWALGMLLVQGAGALFFLWSLAVTDLSAFLGLRQLAGGADVEQLTVGGPYRYVRHPMYTGALAVLWFTPWMTANWLALTLGVTLYFWIGGLFEERKLLRQFGGAYAAYRRQTPMLIPWPRRAHQPEG